MTPHLTHLEHRTEPLLRRLVGSILREQRERQRRTLRDVAEDARVSVAYLSEVERGRKEASSEVLAAVCRALGLRLVDLVGTAHAQLALRRGPRGGGPDRARGRATGVLASARARARDRHRRSGRAPPTMPGRARDRLRAVLLAA